jgi:nitrate/TMAO reductase-like tetraheme cytochrome c subunit
MLNVLGAVLLALSAAAPPGEAAGDADCAACHEQAAAAFAHTTHARIRGFETPDGVTGCASCHGDTAKHLETGEVEGLRRFGGDAEADSEACLRCHATRHGRVEGFRARRRGRVHDLPFQPRRQ